jgi:ethanolamine-phosphate phospho-lyase
VIRTAAAAGSKIAVFYCESALSCGGQIMLPDRYLRDVHIEMKRHGALCVADEVQTGFGRMGDRFWGFEKQVCAL